MTDATVTQNTYDAEFGDYYALLKPRVMTLVVFTAAVGLIVAPVPMPFILAFSSILFIALGAGASGALNMWWDADIDEIMKRTQSRPVPSGRVSANSAMIMGLWLSVLSVAMLGLASNWFAAFCLAFTIFFYAVVYSMWLKRSTPQNIVIGGAAGAFPPMVGWAAATGGVAIESVLMFAVIFMWTPPHFWALALFMNEDYSDAGVPMMTVTHGKPHTRRQMWYYTLLLAPIALVISFTSIGGPIYFVAAVVLSAMFIKHAWGVLGRAEDTAIADSYAAERKMFRFSLLHLFGLFTALLVEAAMRALELSPTYWPVWI